MSPAHRRAVALGGLRLGFALVVYTLAAVAYRAASTGRPGLLAVVLATIVVAVLLHLAEDPLAKVADRMAYGKRAESQRVVRGLLRRMASALPVDEVVPRLAQAAGRTVGGPRAAVTVSLADGREWTQVWPPDGAAGESAITAGVPHHGVPIGAIKVDLPAAETGPAERRLLDELAAPAGLALSTVRLTLELRQRIAQLERANAALIASRDRLRTARQDEQRRLRADVDRHVLRHLVAAQRALDASTIDRGEAAARCEQALDELRLIARGIYPSRLGEAGLLVSLDGWLERARAHVDIAARTPLTMLRTNPELEACMYFCAVTALDALATAGASRLVAEVSETEADVRLRVSGDGAPELSRETLTALRDRIEAFDGALKMTAEPAVLLSFRAPLHHGAPAPRVTVAEVAP